MNMQYKQNNSTKHLYIEDRKPSWAERKSTYNATSLVFRKNYYEPVLK